MNLQPYIKQIKELNPLSQRLFYNIEHWKNYNFNNQTILDDIEIITNEFRNGISRQEIIDFIGQNQDNLRMGFILTMIWGHGFSEHGKADNRGPWKVSQMLENLSKSEDILLNANNCLNNHDFKGAHNEFKDMKNGKYKIISFYAKKARGLMTRFIIENDIDEEEQLQAFDADNYHFNSRLSKPLKPVFTRG